MVQKRPHMDSTSHKLKSSTNPFSLIPQNLFRVPQTHNEHQFKNFPFIADASPRTQNSIAGPTHNSEPATELI